MEIDKIEYNLPTVLSDITSFEIILNGITPTNNFGRYLFLNIKQGNNEIIELHKRLYTGILEDYFPVWLKGKTFLPHMTVGHFDNEEKFEIATKETVNINDSFKAIVNKVSVEIIDANEDSIIEMEIELV